MKYMHNLIDSINPSEFQFIMPFLGKKKCYGDYIAPEFWLF